jgi:phage gpG-like protein
VITILNDFGDVIKEAKRLKNGAISARTTRPVMDKIAADMFRVEKAVFSSSGRRGGGSWAKLKDTTVKRKGTSTILRTSGANPGYSSIGDDALYNSLTEPGSRYNVLRIGRDSVEFGTDRPDAGVHQYGSRKRNIPKRPFLRFLPSDTNRWTNWITEHLMKPHTKK